MKRIDYNKIMCIVGLLLIIVFCVVLIIDYVNYDIFNSTPFSTIILMRIIEFWLTGAILVFLYNENTNLKETNYLIQNIKLPKAFEGYKIAHISDVHNTNSKRIKKYLLQALKKNKPDIVVITGDLIDSRRTSIISAKEFLKSIREIAPIYYVVGNHESRLYDVQHLINEVQNVGANVLRNISIEMQKQGECIEILGVDDAAFYSPLENNYEIAKRTEDVLKAVTKENNKFKILLIHRPELLEIYADYNFDLVFTGHAHGGQIRLPLLGGIIAPGQGIFPKYTKGIYKIKNTQMVVSRGIGNSKFPFRINNRPEIIMVTLTNQLYEK